MVYVRSHIYVKDMCRKGLLSYTLSRFSVVKKPSKNNLHHLFRSFRSIFIFSSVVYLQYTPSSKRNLYSKIIEKSEAVYFFHVSKSLHPFEVWCSVV